MVLRLCTATFARATHGHITLVLKVRLEDLDGKFLQLASHLRQQTILLVLMLVIGVNLKESTHRAALKVGTRCLKMLYIIYGCIWSCEAPCGMFQAQIQDAFNAKSLTVKKLKLNCQLPD